MSKRIRAKGSGRSDSVPGNVTGLAADEERCRLKRDTGPSAVVNVRIEDAISNGSPSVDSPSVMCTTVGGYECGCAATHLVERRLRAPQRLAHRRAPGVHRIEPDGKLIALVEETALAVRDLARPLFEQGRVERDLTDRNEVAARERPAQRRADGLAVSDRADLEVVVHVFALGTARDERLKQAVDDVGELLGFRAAVRGAREAVFHGTGLIDDEKEAGRRGPADFSCVRHRRSVSCHERERSYSLRLVECAPRVRQCQVM